MNLPRLARFAALGAATLALAMPALADRSSQWRQTERGGLYDRLYGGSDGYYGQRGHDRGYDRGRHGGAVVLFADPNFSGRAIEVTGPVCSLRETGLEDRASSARILSGTWEVCTGRNFSGRCQIVSGQRGFPRLARFDFNDNISSLRPVVRGGRDDRHWRAYDDRRWRDDRRYRHDGHHGRSYRPWSGGSGAVVLYADPGGYGRAISINRPVRHLNDLRFNDIVSSLEVRSGAWLACSDPDFRGRCRVIEGRIHTTKPLGLNDNITSLRPLERGDGRRGDHHW